MRNPGGNRQGELPRPGLRENTPTGPSSWRPFHPGAFVSPPFFPTALSAQRDMSLEVSIEQDHILFQEVNVKSCVSRALRGGGRGKEEPLSVIAMGERFLLTNKKSLLRHGAASSAANEHTSEGGRDDRSRTMRNRPYPVLKCSSSAGQRRLTASRSPSA